MTTFTFWTAAGERAIKTAAQTLLVLWAADGGFDLFHVQVGEASGLALGAAVLSLLTSIVSAEVGNDGPSLANETLARTVSPPHA